MLKTPATFISCKTMPLMFCVCLLVSGIYSAPFFTVDTVTSANGKARITWLINNFPDTLFIDSVVVRQQGDNALSYGISFRARVSDLADDNWYFYGIIKDSATLMGSNTFSGLKGALKIPPNYSAQFSTFDVNECPSCCSLKKQTASARTMPSPVILHFYYYSKQVLIDSLVYADTYVSPGAVELLSGPRLFNMTAYPNPGRNDIVISGFPVNITLLEIADIRGQKVASFSYPCNLVKWDAHEFAAGLYLIKARTKTGSFTKTVLIQR